MNSRNKGATGERELAKVLASTDMKQEEANNIVGPMEMLMLWACLEYILNANAPSGYPSMMLWIKPSEIAKKMYRW